jgi:hypothetical protein
MPAIRTLSRSSVLRYSESNSNAEAGSNASSANANNNGRQPPPPPPPLDEGEQAIYDKLHAKFSPTKLQVQDISGACLSCLW